MGSQTPPKLPVIDLSKEDLKPGTQNWFSACKEICQALEEHGCFIVECKDVSLDLHNRIFDAAKELHDLPIEVKMENISDKPFRGYFSASAVHESLGIDNAIALDDTQKFTHLITNANKIARTMMKLDQMVIRMVFESYGVEKQYDSHIGSTDYVLRVAFQVWSNNRIHPCCHRVTLSANEPRHTLGLVTFHNGVIRVPDQLVDDQHPLKYKQFDHIDYLRMQMNYSRTHKGVYPIEAYCGI
ncbi:hypothetical protein JRO89_XS09G0140600 [Xanthoceras sorbifolium]|uniref:Non-haem dioxygenase N-terminal domain-containing protein n=1 Tax=Xanthoceras sorbifolium TaxID=99658 RepID=A0ABQ8HLB4_9ROSI|nr:hypothetical protein JRO89_XS09G0140600 [Xanthoceras sorbifolium]